MVPYLAQRMTEASSWGGIAAFLGSTGASLIGAGFSAPGMVLVALGAGAGAVAVFLKDAK
jgi:hypothetical protein